MERRALALGLPVFVKPASLGSSIGIAKVSDPGELRPAIEEALSYGRKAVVERGEEVLPIAEEVLELDLNPNRSDCLGVYGVAREVHAITGAPLTPAPWESDALAEGEGEASDYASVKVEARLK